MNTALSQTIHISQFNSDCIIPQKSHDGKHLIATIKTINHIYFSDGEVLYSSNYWDFAKFIKIPVPHKCLCFNFDSLIGSPFIEDVKNFVLLSILENKYKIQSIYKRFITIKNFFLYMDQKFSVNSIVDISDKMIKTYINEISANSSLVSIRWTKATIKFFYIQYSANFKAIITPSILHCLSLEKNPLYAAYQYEHRAQNIPPDYFNKFESACIRVLNNSSAPFYFRGIAGVYIILAETGLRIGEVLNLTIDSLKSTQILNGKKVNYLSYETWKRERGNNKKTIAMTYINDLSYHAFQTLIDVYEERRTFFNLSYLFMGGRYPRKRTFPYHSEKFLKTAYSFFIYLHEQHLLDTINLPKELYPTIHRFNMTTRLKNGQVKTLTFPDSQQFRFHCCSVLAEKGVPIEYIQRFMSHLTSDMVKYHILPKDSPQENMEFSLKILREIVSGQINILGDSKGLSEKIQQFIAENNFHVEKDLDTICKKLSQKIPIRQKTGGVCIKSSQLRECSLDAQTNDFYCAYGVCPNIVHFYYMADISYRKCNELLETITINQKHDLTRQVQKELNMLHFIAQKLLVELHDLRKTLLRDGKAAILSAHPELERIIDNLDSIEKEASTWISKKL